ncbi:MAG: glycosyl transferase [Flavobacterium sp. BFFFF2]|nr:MAG: glycosyl transferase [Flavobacterium sp. BFFFF2]
MKAMNQKLPLSALMITYNEADNLAEVLPNLDRADEIVILDSYSTDATKQLALSHGEGLRFYEQKFVDFTSQRNATLEKATHDWVLFIDGDERIPEALWQEIEAIVCSEGPTHDAYYFYRKFMYCGKPIHFGGTQSDKNYRLFKKSKAHYTQERLVHETLTVQGTTGALKTKLIHYSFTDYAIYHRKMMQYGRLKAKELRLKGRNGNLFKLIFKPIYKFLYSYLIRLGLFDGYPGLVLCYLQAKSVFVTQRELFKKP